MHVGGSHHQLVRVPFALQRASMTPGQPHHAHAWIACVHACWMYAAQWMRAHMRVQPVQAAPLPLVRFPPTSWMMFLWSRLLWIRISLLTWK